MRLDIGVDTTSVECGCQWPARWSVLSTQRCMERYGDPDTSSSGSRYDGRFPIVALMKSMMRWQELVGTVDVVASQRGVVDGIRRS